MLYQKRMFIEEEEEKEESSSSTSKRELGKEEEILSLVDIDRKKEEQTELCGRHCQIVRKIL